MKLPHAVIAAFISGVFALPVAAGDFRAAAFKVDITPDTPQWLTGYEPRQSAGVHDRLYHRIVALHDGSTAFALVASDLGVISPEFYDRLAAKLENETGVRRSQFWWTVTHTHSAPEVGASPLPKAFLSKRFDHEWDRAYADKVAQSLIEGVKAAIGKLEPARLAVGWGMSMANMNRRARAPDGKILLGLNPEGPVDRRIGLLRLERPEGSLIALIANYAMHGTVLGAVKEVSGDAPGIVSAYAEEKLGAPVLYVNGAAGNIGPLYYFNAAFRNLPLFNVLLGDRILAANRMLRAGEGEAPALKAEERIIETARKPGLAWPQELASYGRETGAGNGLVRIPVRFVRLRGDTVLWAAPLELFCEIAIRVRNESPFANTFYFGYTNGWLGYLLTEDELKAGGYEAGVSPFTGAAERDFGDGVILHLQGMTR